MKRGPNARSYAVDIGDSRKVWQRTWVYTNVCREFLFSAPDVDGGRGIGTHVMLQDRLDVIIPKQFEPTQLARIKEQEIYIRSPHVPVIDEVGETIYSACVKPHPTRRWGTIPVELCSGENCRCSLPQ